MVHSTLTVPAQIRVKNSAVATGLARKWAQGRKQKRAAMDRATKSAEKDVERMAKVLKFLKAHGTKAQRKELRALRDEWMSSGKDIREELANWEARVKSERKDIQEQAKIVKLVAAIEKQGTSAQYGMALTHQANSDVAALKELEGEIKAEKALAKAEWLDNLRVSAIEQCCNLPYPMLELHRRFASCNTKKAINALLNELH